MSAASSCNAFTTVKRRPWIAMASSPAHTSKTAFHTCSERPFAPFSAEHHKRLCLSIRMHVLCALLCFWMPSSRALALHRCTFSTWYCTRFWNWQDCKNWNLCLGSSTSLQRAPEDYSASPVQQKSANVRKLVAWATRTSADYLTVVDGGAFFSRGAVEAVVDGRHQLQLPVTSRHARWRHHQVPARSASGELHLGFRVLDQGSWFSESGGTVES